jgi:uncharacterized protein (DUF427 family)
MRGFTSRPEPAPVGPGQESVWDYPRPPRLEEVGARVRVELAGRVVADSTRALRILETSHPPSYYLPPQDCSLDLLEDEMGTSFCEWKGEAVYETVRVGDAVAERAAWRYPAPNRAYAAIAEHRSFYPGLLDCTVDGVAVTAQPGGFYGGWVTPDVVGPFKGEPGTGFW